MSLAHLYVDMRGFLIHPIDTRAGLLRKRSESDGVPIVSKRPRFVNTERIAVSSLCVGLLCGQQRQCHLCSVLSGKATCKVRAGAKAHVFRRDFSGTARSASIAVPAQLVAVLRLPRQRSARHVSQAFTQTSRAAQLAFRARR